jgi:hypothetical protein
VSIPKFTFSPISSNGIHPTSQDQTEKITEDRCSHNDTTALPHHAPQQLPAILPRWTHTSHHDHHRTVCRAGIAPCATLPPPLPPPWHEEVGEPISAGVEDDPFHGDWAFW